MALSNITIRRLLPPLLITIACALALALLRLSGATATLDQQVAARTNFHVRGRLGMEPQLDPRIKIITWDDKTTELLSAWGAPTATDTTLATWARIIGWLASAKPQGIYIDKLFENPLGLPDAEAFVRQLQGLSSKVVIGSYLTLEKQSYRIPLPAPLTALPNLHSETEGGRYLYGPHPKVQAAFPFIGHIRHLESGFIRPIERVVGGGGILHWSLAGNTDVETDGTAVRVGSRYVPTTDDGRVMVNLLPASRFDARSLSLGWVLSEIAGGHPVSHIEPGDLVVILPAAYTGGTDYKDTVVGKISGGYVQVAMLNSVLTGQWLNPIDGGAVADGVAVLAAAVLATFLAPQLFWPLFAGVLLAGVAGCLALFAWLGLAVTWFAPALAFTVTGVALAVERHVRTYIRAVLLQQELELGDTVQSLFLPKTRSGSCGDVSYRIAFKPYGPMSGDWIQTHFREGDQSGPDAVIAIGDVVGKGPRAALATAVIASVFRRLAGQSSFEVPVLLTELDRALNQTFRGLQNSTLSLVAIYGSRVETNAFGAPHWLHAQADGNVTSLRTKAVNLLGHGKRKDDGANIGGMVLAPGDMLIAYTDGVIDGMQARGDFQRALQEALASDPSLKDTDALFRRVETLADSVGRASRLPDDFTLVVIRRELANASGLTAA